VSNDKLPSDWVDQIFKKLSIRYGRQFMARWDGINEAEVKSDWADVLGGFLRRPDAIAFALDNLPADYPTTATQFRDLCNTTPAEREVFRALPLSREPMPARLLAMLDKLKEPGDVDAQYASPKGWAYRLRDREAAGQTLGAQQRRMWRQALRANEGPA